MQDEKANRIQTMFLEALEVPDGQRTAWLAEQCGSDTELLQQVGSLLAYDNPDCDPLEQGVHSGFLSDVGLVPGADNTSFANRRFLVEGNIAADASLETNDQLQPGDSVGGYIIDELVNSGGMGAVYRAHQLSVNRTVALKTLHSSLENALGIQRFLDECYSVARLFHPRIVPLLDAGNFGRRPFYVMEYIDGVNLQQFLKTKQIPIRESVELVVKIAEGVSYAHERGVLHCDIKPANILIDRDGNPRLADFGLAISVSGAPSLSACGGTPAYMAPEQMPGSTVCVTVRTDVYGLGATLHRVLYGISPQEAMLPRSGRSIPRDVEAICRKSLSQSPWDRYSSVEDFRADLLNYLHRRPVQARPLGSPARLVRWCQRNPAAAVAACLISTTLVAASVVSSMFAMRESRAAALARDRERLVTELLQQRQKDATAAARRRGDWRELGKLASMALESPDIVPGDRAWYAIQLAVAHSANPAKGEIRDLLASQPLDGLEPDMRGEYLLLCADSGLLFGENDFRRQVQEAIDSGLSIVSAAYARSLLAPTACLARDELGTLGLDRVLADPRAAFQYGIACLMTGQARESRAVAAYCSGLYDRDPRFRELGRWADVLQNQFGAGSLPSISMSPMNLGEAQSLDVAVDVGELAVVIETLQDLLERIDRLTPVEERAAEQQAKKLEAITREAFFKIRPGSEGEDSRWLIWVKDYVDLLRAIESAEANEQDAQRFEALRDVAEMAERLNQRNREGLFCFLHGILWVKVGEMQKAEQVFTEGYRTPSVLPRIPGLSAYYALRCAVRASLKGDEAAPKRAAGHAKACRQAGVPKSLRTDFTRLTAHAGDFGTSWAEVDEWMRESPEAIEPRIERVVIAQKANQPQLALLLAQKFLIENEPHPRVSEVIAWAEQELAKGQ